MAGPTKNQQAVLDAIAELTASGLPPTYEEIRIKLGLKGRGQVSWYLEKLRAKGLVEWDRQQQRSIRILDRDPAPLVYGDFSSDALRMVIRDASRVLAERIGPSQAAAILLVVAEDLQSPLANTAVAGKMTT